MFPKPQPAPHQQKPYQEQIRDVAQHITNHYIGEVPHDIYNPERSIVSLLDTPNDHPERIMPVTATLLLLNSCLGKNTLIEGGKGTGKTQLAGIVGTMLYQLPVEFFQLGRVVGTPGANVTDIYATLDIGRLNKGEDAGVFYPHCYGQYVIFDELNRFSELEQNRIREGIATGVWKFTYHSFDAGRGQVVVAAINPEEYGGTFFLNQNLVDNFGNYLIAPRYNSLAHTRLVEEAEANIARDLGDRDSVVAFLHTYEQDRANTAAIQKALAELTKKTHKLLVERGVPIIHNGVMDAIAAEVHRIPFEPEAVLFYHAALAEMSYSAQFGTNRIEDPASESSHDTPFLSTKLREPMAGRFLQDWRRTAKAIAWYFGREKAGIEELKAAFLYTAPRRIETEPDSDFFQKVLQQPRTVSYRVKLAKNVMEEAWKSYSDFRSTPSGAQNPAFSAIRSAVRIITGEETGTITDAVSLLKNADHPLARACLEAIAINEFAK